MGIELIKSLIAAGVLIDEEPDDSLVTTNQYRGYIEHRDSVVTTNAKHSNMVRRLNFLKGLRPEFKRRGGLVEESLPVWLEDLQGLIHSQQQQANLETRARDLYTGQVARDLLKHQWEALMPVERRIVDVATARRSYSSSEGTSMGDLIEAHYWKFKLREDRYVQTFMEDKPWVVFEDEGLNTKLINRTARHIYSTHSRDTLRDLAADIFAVQRVTAHLSELILALFYSHIPPSFKTNHHAVDSYFREVIKQGRAHIYDAQGISLALDPHYKHPYSDREWRKSLNRASEAALPIAQRIAEECPELVAITLYGPLTRKSKNYVMFSPNQAIKLGAFFPTTEQSKRAQEVASDTADNLKVKIRMGTSHLKGGWEELTTWDIANPKELKRIKRGVSPKAPESERRYYLERLGELVMQLRHGTPLVVNNEPAFTALLKDLEGLEARYFTPLFGQALDLYKHIELGYPSPIETKTQPGKN